MKILIAEDDLVQRRFLQVMLSRSGRDVIAVSDGQQAWDMLQTEHIRMVITDWIMPEVSGLELVRKIRSSAFPNYTYLILLTSKDTRNSIVEGLEAGADDYLTKPFDKDELMARLSIGERILELETRLQEMAIHDSLTGLLNRRALYAKIQVEMNRATRELSPISMIMLDIDHFKSINDRYGHQAGDKALCMTSEVLLQNKRAYDAIGRWGGEEFLVLLPRTGMTDARTVAERFRSAIASARLSLADGRGVRFTVSLGVSSVMDGHIDIEALIHQADAAMYLAKHQGRNRICLADENFLNKSG